MSYRRAVKYEGGEIFWCYPNQPHWFWKSRDDAEKLRDEFAHPKHGGMFKEIVAQLDQAIADYDADRDDDSEWQYYTEMGLS